MSIINLDQFKSKRGRVVALPLHAGAAAHPWQLGTGYPGRADRPAE